MLFRIKSYYKAVNRLYFLFFLTGILTGLLFYFNTEDAYEQRIFAALANDINKLPESTSDSSRLLSSMRLVHQSIAGRRDLFNNLGGVKAGVIQPVVVDLMTGQGACGSYALVLARLLKELGIETRMVQMTVGEQRGGHIIVEAKYGDRWAVLDAMYDLHFTRPDGKLASFSDVQHNWRYYKTQVPANYDHNYRYEDLSYTNWQKIPILMPAVKKILNVVIGKKSADTISLRMFVLRKYDVFFIVTLFLQIFIITHIVYLAYKKHNQTKPSLKVVGKDTNTRQGSVVLVKPQTELPPVRQ